MILRELVDLDANADHDEEIMEEELADDESDDDNIDDKTESDDDSDENAGDEAPSLSISALEAELLPGITDNMEVIAKLSEQLLAEIKKH